MEVSLIITSQIVYCKQASVDKWSNDYKIPTSVLAIALPVVNLSSEGKLECCLNAIIMYRHCVLHPRGKDLLSMFP